MTGHNTIKKPDLPIFQAISYTDAKPAFKVNMFYYKILTMFLQYRKVILC